MRVGRVLGKNMTIRNTKIAALLVTTAAILACVPTLATPALPTLDPLSIDTVIAETAGAAATQTALRMPPSLTPSLTPLPTNTPTTTPTSTPTFVFFLFTPTVPSPTPEPSLAGGQFACQIDSQKPANNTVYKPGADFDALWQVTNTGTETWDENSADFRYISGDKIHKTAMYDFGKTVKPGGNVTLGVDMKAPGNPGTYSTTWKIRIGSNQFCTMNLTILVR